MEYDHSEWTDNGIRPMRSREQAMGVGPELECDTCALPLHLCDCGIDNNDMPVDLLAGW